MKQIHLGSFELKTKGDVKISCDFYIPKVDVFPDLMIDLNDELILSKTSLQKDPVFYSSIKEALVKIGYDIKDRPLKLLSLDERLTIEMPEDFLIFASAKGFMSRDQNIENAKREALTEILDLDENVEIKISQNDAFLGSERYLVIDINEYSEILSSALIRNLDSIDPNLIVSSLNFSFAGAPETKEEKVALLEEKKSLGNKEYSEFVFSLSSSVTDLLKTLSETVRLDKNLLKATRLGAAKGFLILKPL